MPNPETFDGINPRGTETLIPCKDATARSGVETINNKIGANSGIASLDANGKVPSSQLPSFVDDVVEGYYKAADDRFYEESTFETMITPTSGKSWVDVSTNKSYRWTGSVYVRVDEGVQIGETADTAFAGNRGKALETAVDGIKNGSSINSFGGVETALSDKVDKVDGKGLSTNDFTDAYKTKVDGAFPRSEQAVLGAKNLFDPQILAKNSSVYAVSGDDVTASVSDNLSWPYIGVIPLKKGTYILSRTNTAGITSYRTSDDSYGTSITLWVGVDSVTITLANDGGIKVKGFTGSEWTYPATGKFMIRLASDPDDTYVPHAMTNEELTKKVTLKKIVESAGNQTWADQLTALNTAYSALSGAEKLNTFIGVNDNANDGLYRLFAPSVGVFGNISMFSDGATVINTLRLGSQIASTKTINTSGSVTVTNLTNETNSNKLILYSKG